MSMCSQVLEPLISYLILPVVLAASITVCTSAPAPRVESSR